LSPRLIGIDADDFVAGNSYASDDAAARYDSIKDGGRARYLSINAPDGFSSSLRAQWRANLHRILELDTGRNTSRTW
jgi:hypothetical protein